LNASAAAAKAEDAFQIKTGQQTKMSELDYQKIGFKCSIEIHQQQPFGKRLAKN
jgi:hypothetical protein